MRAPRSLALTACAAACTIGLIAGTAAPASAAESYVALGDSYSSGVGAGSIDPNSGNCMRSNNAFPKLWANAHAPSSFAFVACSGATTTSVISSQLSAVTSSTTLVTVTAGGNDAGFSSVLEDCVLGSDATCLASIDSAKAFMRNTLPGRLDTLNNAIESRAPSAHVVVLGYPRLYIIVSVCVGLSNTKRTALNGAADLLDDTISAATSRAGFTFSDVRDEFAGHELCSGDDWLNAVTFPIGNSYHPTALGQRSGFLPALNATD
jgi:lysophospholipase L1-like esterase